MTMTALHEDCMYKIRSVLPYIGSCDNYEQREHYMVAYTLCHRYHNLQFAVKEIPI